MAIFRVFLAAALLKSVLTAPQFNPRDATILLFENDFNGIDPWHWRFETSNGIRQEQFGTEGDGSRLQGSFSWQPRDAGGATYSVSYEADEKGYRPRVAFGTGRIGVRPTTLPQVTTEPPFMVPVPELGSSAALSLIG